MRASLIGMASILSLLAACSTTKPMTAESPSTTAPAQHNATNTASQGAQTGAVDASKLNGNQLAAQVAQQKTDLNSKSVMFAFDDYTVKPDYTDMLKQQAQFLKDQKTDHLTLQGNADERGSAEYNLALGQKRAEAVRKALGLLGAPEERIESISFGEEKPKATCHEESCWAQNRRVDFLHADKH
ncbi:MAG: peptidoglycan-associated lipoprotein Pal [Burkholderiales bacterium]|nr:peptidoglycan-associated lipoprotein Pal [Burkholderiales bacterium]